MDYEKRYNEIVKAVKELRDVNPHDEGINEWINDKFPELAESEDEKIRKAVVDAVVTLSDSPLKTKMLAWLEKQGEQKLYVNDNAKEMFIKALERVEEQNAKGYKLTDCDKNSWWEDFKNYTSCTIEQKPTGWSEKLIADVFEMVGLAKIVREQENDALTRALQFAMIELAKYSVVPQIRQEWSEEDKNALKVVTDVFEQYGVHLLNYPAFMHWIKTLPERISFNTYWKPSDEQMEALNNINVIGSINYAGQGQELINLYNDLKKLREE